MAVGVSTPSPQVIPVAADRPTDGLRPTVEQVGALIAQRGKKAPAPQFDTTSRPTYGQVQMIIDQVSAELDAEAAGVVYSNSLLTTQVTYLIILLAAATVELSLFPDEQNNSGGLLWARYQSSLTRFRQLLAAEGGGTRASVGGVQAVGPALGAWQRVNAILAGTTTPNWPGPSPIYTDFGSDL